MPRFFAALVALLALAGAAAAPARYINARYGYAVDLPAGFGPVREADNSDGGLSKSADGQSQLAVWGANLLLDPLSADVQGRIDSASQEGWEISYRKVTARWAS